MFARSTVRHTLLVLVGILLTGCVTSIPVNVKKVEQRELPDIQLGTELAPIKLEVASINIKRGTPIAELVTSSSGYHTGGHLCSPSGGNIFWSRGRIDGPDIEFQDIFFEELERARFNVVGNPKDIFAAERKEAVEPVYVVGAQITEISAKICSLHHWWDARPLNTQTGSASIKVNWQIFSRLEKKVVYETETEGFGELAHPARAGFATIVNDAFASAAANLAADSRLLTLVSAQAPSFADIGKVDAASLRIDRQKRLKNSITDSIDRIRLGVVTLDSGAGHGSGFFISSQLVMTNHHVVKGQKFIKVRLVTGREIIGEVVRSHLQRDVALVQVEDSGYRPLAIRMEPVKITEDVFAIGTPQSRELSGTVTKGIVSKFTKNRFGLEDIQADVDIHGGNSGGPLLDKNGNVVGVSYAGISTDGNKLSSGLNFFVPIYDALDKLNVRFKNPASAELKP